MTPQERSQEASAAPDQVVGRQAGFSLTRTELEEVVREELGGMVTDLTLLSADGLWVAFLAREPCCGARSILNLRTREHLGPHPVRDVFRAAERNREVQHPAVLSVRRFGQTRDLVWVTTRARRGRLMRLRFGSRPASAHGRAVEFLRRVARPIDAVHREGLVHGNLTTRAFHCDAAGRIRVRNLGFEVPVLRALADRGVQDDVGSCAAPEVLSGAPPRAESDQYALAALILRGMTGRGPRDEGIEWAAVPETLRAVLRRALRPDPDERFASVLEMWEALDPDAAAQKAGDAAQDTPVESPPWLQEEREIGPAPAPDSAAERPRSGRPLRGGTRRRRASRRETASPWARTLGAAAVLVLFVGSLEWVDWQQLGSLALLAAGQDSAATSRPVGPNPRESETVDTPGAEPAPPADGGAAIETPTSPASGGALGAPLPLPESGPEPEPETTGAAPPADDAPTATAAGLPSTPTEEPPSARQAPGTLSLHSYPWGEVYLDGDYVGSTPLVDFRVSAGDHEIRIERSGYETHVETITVGPGEAVTRTGIVLGGEGR